MLNRNRLTVVKGISRATLAVAPAPVYGYPPTAFQMVAEPAHPHGFLAGSPMMVHPYISRGGCA